MAAKKNAAGWNALKACLRDSDTAELLALLKDVYAASKEAQVFLHARYAIGGDVLAPYKATITQWINPGDFRKPLSVAKAKKAITDYKKAVGSLHGLAELHVFYCEEVFAFLEGCGVDEEAFYHSLCVMFEQALMAIAKLPSEEQRPFHDRMWQVKCKGYEIGWGVWDDFEQAWGKAGLPVQDT